MATGQMYLQVCHDLFHTRQLPQDCGEYRLAGRHYLGLAPRLYKLAVLACETHGNFLLFTTPALRYMLP